MSDLNQFIMGLRDDYEARNEYGLNFDQEAGFAIQAISNNDFMAKVSHDNPGSTRDALLNQASCGLSLSPAHNNAFLVPRDNAVRLDISARGLLKIATDSGVVQFGKPELVFEGEHFEWRGVMETPVHHFDPFSADRAQSDPFQKLRGGYVVAKLHDGSVIMDHMSAAEIMKARQQSRGANKASSPWKVWPLEMIKKVLIKRAYKTWPQSARLSEAVSVLNEHEGSDFNQDAAPAALRDEAAQHLEAEVRKVASQVSISIEEICKIAGVTAFDQIESKRLPRLLSWLQSKTGGSQ